MSRAWLRVALALTTLTLVCPGGASAHDRKTVGSLLLTIGWGVEPAFSGSENFVEVVVSRADGTPVGDLGDGLTVEVSYGDRQVLLPLVPAGERPGELRATIIPTRPGTYAFHVTGTAAGQRIDTEVTCSETTFDCVTDRAEVEFPASDPSNAELNERVTRALPRAERAVDTASSARRLAIAAIAVAGLALAAAMGFGLGRRRARG